MIHPRLGTLVGARDEEGGRTAPMAARLASHLARCPRCRERLAWAERVRDEVRQATQRTAPAGGWERIAERLDGNERVLLPVMSAGGLSGRSWPAIGKAAAALILFAGAAAAAAPGSPVRAWVERALPGGSPAGEELPPAVSPPSDAAGVVTFLISARGGAVTIALDRPDPELRVRVRPGAGAEVEITATGPAAAARFTRAPGRLTIGEAGAGELVVLLPPSLRATILVDGRAVVRMRDGELVVAETVRADSGTELMFKVGERRIAP